MGFEGNRWRAAFTVSSVVLTSMLTLMAGGQAEATTPSSPADVSAQGGSPNVRIPVCLTRRRCTPPATGPTLGPCPVLPADNPWNTDVSSYPAHPNSANFIASIGTGRRLHPDFGGDGAYGIPFTTVGSDQPKVPIDFTHYPAESDPGPYPFPPDAPVEGGSDGTGDRHVVVVDADNCMLYETYLSYYVGPGWDVANGAVWDLRSNTLRPLGWTSADAAGLPIFPGLVRYDEVASGEVRHAIRFTVSRTQRGYILPATHFASSSTDPNRPPMGLRVRMRADYDISWMAGQARVIAEAMKRYGMIVADNGSDWYFTGATDPRWDDEDLNQLKLVPGSAFEAVYTGDVLS